jgi:hypothetical protein
MNAHSMLGNCGAFISSVALHWSGEVGARDRQAREGEYEPARSDLCGDAEPDPSGVQGEGTLAA